MRTVAVFCPIEPSDRERLERVLPDFTFVYEPSDEVIARAEVALGEIPPSKLPLAKHLKWLQLSMAGTDPYTKDPTVLPSSVALTNATGAFGLAIAEHMIGCLFMLVKKLHLYRDHMASHLWQNRGSVDQIEGRTVLVVGLGDLGRAFAAKMKALGCYVIGLRRTVASKPECVDEVTTSEHLDEMLPRADFVVLCLPGTSGTAGMMSRERLMRMKQGAYLINTGRGSAVDTDALCELLQSGYLGGAALDVTDPEPLPPSHPLWDCENALITPHISGKYYLPKTYKNIMDIFAENLRRYGAGEELKSRVDRQTGYCYPQNDR